MTDPASTRHSAAADRLPSSPLARFISRLTAVFSDNGDTSLRKSLEGVIEQHRIADEGLSAEERSMLLNILEFGKLRIDDVMVPRADIVAVDHASSMGELIALFKSAGHSRLPVYRDTLDDPVGMVHIKDALGWIAATRSGDGAPQGEPNVPADVAASSLDLSSVDLSTPLSETRIRRDVLFVPPSMLAADLLVKMQTSRIHMAIVVDEYGGTDGLVSIEDIVEIIVGDIEDEHDVDGTPMIVETDVGYDADARLPIEDLEKIVGIELVHADREEDVDTLGGLVFSMIGRIPVRGELIHHEGGIEFEVLEGDPRRLKKLRIHLVPRKRTPPPKRGGPDSGQTPEGETTPVQ